ncbi:MAG TPA: hypothetical protein VK158_00035 [Acidobacteriota bacterium]|nr:hypothetical protein [Acidobacteriota bacterium]
MAEDVYDADYLDAMMDNDELTPGEAGLMHWYDYDAEKSFQQDDMLARMEEENEYM